MSIDTRTVAIGGERIVLDVFVLCEQCAQCLGGGYIPAWLGRLGSGLVELPPATSAAVGRHPHSLVMPLSIRPGHHWRFDQHCLVRGASSECAQPARGGDWSFILLPTILFDCCSHRDLWRYSPLHSLSLSRSTFAFRFVISLASIRSACRA